MDKLEKKELGEIGQLAKVTCNEGVFRETNLRSNFVRLLIYRRGWSILQEGLECTLLEGLGYFSGGLKYF